MDVKHQMGSPDKRSQALYTINCGLAEQSTAGKTFYLPYAYLL